jgi:aldehyde dehydrogenase (NAD+)
LINNEWVSATTGKKFATINPATGEKIADVEEAGPEDLERAVKAARKAFETWGKTAGAYRAKLLNRLADLIEQNKEELAALETLDNGKPYQTHSLTRDLPHVIATYRYYAGWANEKLTGKNLPLDGNYFSVTRLEPVGVVGQVIPWNFPLMMQAWKFGPALAAGCTIILKPSKETPLSALRVGELCIQAGFPPGVINILTGAGAAIGDMICKHPGIDKIAFTGSTDVGKQIAKMSAEANLKKVSLELGGKGPNIVFADADFDEAVNTALHAIYFNMGQACSAGSRTYVEASIYDQFVARAAELAKKKKSWKSL